MVAISKKRSRLQCCCGVSSNYYKLLLVVTTAVGCCLTLIGGYILTRSLAATGIYIVPEGVPNGKAATTDSGNAPISDPIIVKQRQPTHSACHNHDGIYHIAMGDIGGAAGTIFFQFVIAQILYAQQHNLKPWVHLSHVSHVVYDPMVHGTGDGLSLTAQTGRNATYWHRRGGHRRDYVPGPLNQSQPLQSETLHFSGTGVWEHYFEPVSDFVPGDISCTKKLYVTMDLYLITPGLHGYADYAPRCWRYKYLPDYVTKPHLGISEWLLPQRQSASRVVQQYIEPRQYLQQAARLVNPNCSLTAPCLGIHVRHSDKAAGRRILHTAEFLPYVKVFVERAGQDARVYLATDSTLVLDEIKQSWPEPIQKRIRTGGDNLLRSNDEVAVFDMDGASQHHRTNREILVEIIALSHCTFLVHGFSAVSESAIWMNERLHEQSINLEDPDHLSPLQFQNMIALVKSKSPSSELPRPIRSVDIWPELFQRSSHEQTVTNHACDGYDGVLLISAVGRSISAGGAFFNSVLNQLMFADQHNLKPWVHLRGNHSATSLVYDKDYHDGDETSFEMLHGMAIGALRSNQSRPESLYPNKPAQKAVELTTRLFSVQGTGIWQNYFDPVSDFVPRDTSCRNQPLMEMEESLVSPGLESFSPHAVRAWRYDQVSDAHWWNPSLSQSLKDWYEPMRKQGSELVRKYYRFRPFIVRRADTVNPVLPDEPCLGLHLRNGDKMGTFREKIRPKNFEPYIDAFEKAGGRAVYVASDSHRALQFIYKNYPERLTKIMRSQGQRVVRSTKLDWPAHYIENHHRVNSEVLVDILALSKCQILLHGFSTVSEAAIYLNPALHNRSVNLEDPGRIDPSQFAEMVKAVI